MDNAASIISSIAAILGVIGTIYTILVNQTTRKFLPPDNSLMIKRVLRIPLDWNVWKKRKKAHTLLHNLTDVTASLFVLTELIILIVNKEGVQQVLSKIFSLSILSFGIVIAGITYIYIGLNMLLRRKEFGKTPEEGRFFIFKEAIVIVEAEYSAILIRCYEALKMLNIKAVDLDQNSQTLEGQKTLRLYASVGVVKIEILPTYQVVIDPASKREYAITVSFTTSHSNSLELASEITNAFIEQFIGQTKP